MRKRLIVIVIGIALLVSAWVGSVSAQDVPGYPVPGYPVETDTPTEEPTKPPETTPPPSTPEPTQPQPTEAPPTWVPPQPTPTETPDLVLETCPFTRVHPMISIIAERFGVSFEDVAEMFCSSHMGIGEIIRYLEDLQQPAGGPDVGNPWNFPGHEGQGLGLFWWVFSRIGHPGNTHWSVPS